MDSTRRRFMLHFLGTVAAVGVVSVAKIGTPSTDLSNGREQAEAKSFTIFEPQQGLRVAAFYAPHGLRVRSIASIASTPLKWQLQYNFEGASYNLLPGILDSEAEPINTDIIAPSKSWVQIYVTEVHRGVKAADYLTVTLGV